jgi:multidrug efflux system outer membrane protein
MKNTLALALTSALLSGCALGPEYARPDLGLNEHYAFAVSPEQARAMADIHWAELFQDAEISSVIRMAVARNLDLKLALTRIEVFQAQSRVTRSLYFPSVLGDLGTSPGSPAVSDNSYSLGAILSWELDFFGKLRRSNEAARADLLASEAAARALMSTLVAATTTTYLSLRELDQEYAITLDNIASQEGSLELVRSLLRGGVASGAEEQQAIAQLATTRARLPQIAQAIVATENELNLLLGGQPGQIKRSAQSSLPQAPAVPDLGLPSELLERRPDVRAAEHALEAATARVGVAIANRFPIPTIGIGGFFGLVGIDLGDTLGNSGDTQDITSWGPNASLPLIDWGRGTANVDAARAQAQIAAISYRSTTLNALREVSNSFSSIAKLRAVIEQNEIRVRAEVENLRLQRMRFRSGVSSYLEVLDAERQVYAAQIDQVRVRRDHLIAHVDLYRALGGGWSEVAISGATAADEAQ